MSFGQTIVIDTLTFDNVDPGVYMLAETTVDEPYYLSIDRTLNPQGVSSFVVKRQNYRNSTATVPGAQDDLLQVHVVIKADLRRFPLSDIDATFNQLNVFLTTDNLKKILRGER